MADIARTQGKIAEEKALKDPQAIQAAKDALAQSGNLTPTEKQLTEQIRNTAMAAYGTGSDLQRAIQAATAVTQGLTGGNLGQALAGGSAPYLAHEISQYLPADQNQSANLMAHAVLGAVVGHFNGNAAVGAAGAFTAEAAAPAIIKAMGWDKDKLTEQQKQTVSALGTLAAGLAGGLVGNSSNSAVAGMEAGKNAVENNALGCSTLTCLNNPLDISRPSLGGGMAGVAGGAAIADALNGDKESESIPNVGKDLTDADKAELGGTGSGTPGGWGPEDEENARNQQSNSSTTDKNAEYVGRDIADGHAFEKHVIEQNEYADLGIKSREQFAQHIENVVKNPTSTKELANGRSAYWDQSSGTVVIRNPKAADGGTAFRPVNGRAYFDNLR